MHTHGTMELAVKAKGSPETRPPLPPQERKSVGCGKQGVGGRW